MNIKTFLVAGLIGGIVNWFLGWLCYGIILVDYFPHPKDSTRAIIYVFLGFVSVGFFLSYFF